MLLLAACAHTPPLAEPLRSLDLPAATAAARTDDERAFVAAVEHLADPASVDTLRQLEATPLRPLARPWLTAALWAQERWPDLLPRLSGADADSVRAVLALPPARWSAATLPAAVPLVPDLPLAVVEAEVGGQAVRLIVDTGAELLVLDDDLARQLGLRTGPDIHVTTSTADAALALVSVPSVAVGAVGWSDQPALVTDLDWLGGLTPGVRGILGWPQLRSLAVTFDAPGGRLVLDHSGSTHDGALLPANELLVRASIHSTPAVFHLDSGSNASELFPATAERLGIATQGGGPAAASGAGGTESHTVREAHVAVQLAGATIEPGGWIVAEDREYESPVRVDGVIGYDLLRLTPFCVDGAAMRFEALPPGSTCATPR